MQRVEFAELRCSDGADRTARFVLTINSVWSRRSAALAPADALIRWVVADQRALTRCSIDPHLVATITIRAALVVDRTYRAGRATEAKPATLVITTANHPASTTGATGLSEFRS